MADLLKKAPSQLLSAPTPTVPTVNYVLPWTTDAAHRFTASIELVGEHASLTVASAGQTLWDPEYTRKTYFLCAFFNCLSICRLC